jgi:hypothetical protein
MIEIIINFYLKLKETLDQECVIPVAQNGQEIAVSKIR